jgi:diacylglycerol kinase family enzyme
VALDGSRLAYSAVVRAVLVVNPQATATTPGGRDVLAHALASEVKLDVIETNHRGHATEVAVAAADDGIDLVVAHGGDGTVNEVVNGLLSDGPRSGLPMLAVVPGGSANVFARALGMSPDPVEATHELLTALGAGSTRKIGLGRADRVWFTFNAGLGWDADVVAAVDRQRGKETGTALYLRAALRNYLRQRRSTATLAVELPDADRLEVHTAFVSNTDPWTYLGSTPVRLNPGCSFDGGLGLFALKSIGLPTVLNHARQALGHAGTRSGRRLLRHDDVESLTISCDEPVNFQVDGDLVGKRTRVEFASVTDALTVVV